MARGLRVKGMAGNLSREEPGEFAVGGLRFLNRHRQSNGINGSQPENRTPRPTDPSRDRNDRIEFRCLDKLINRHNCETPTDTAQPSRLNVVTGHGISRTNCPATNSIESRLLRFVVLN